MNSKKFVYLLMRKLFPSSNGWEVKQAGANVKSSESNTYTGNKNDKLKVNCNRS